MQPDLDEIEERFVALLEGRETRDAVDRWAGRWFADDSLEWDEVSLWALDKLYGIDMGHGPGGAYLHDEEQIRGWLDRLRELRRQERQG
ncbi:hypothetical protein [Actinomadura rugatobispora]|uniref:Uncharacterized protein n=1 Tax=Actinomadura rugatobispora TaxID=1994 RepID=A0ABW1ACV7_9ACTN|nr:hypothetical protein GCM10010200_004490 [Actinomadura rugatobispora]